MSLGSKTQYFSESVNSMPQDCGGQDRISYPSAQHILARKYNSAYTFDVDQYAQNQQDSSYCPHITQGSSSKYNYKLLKMPSDEPYTMCSNNHSDLSQIEAQSTLHNYSSSSSVSSVSSSFADYIPDVLRLIGFGVLVMASVWTYYNWPKVVDWFDGAYQDSCDYFYPSSNLEDSSSYEDLW